MTILDILVKEFGPLLSYADLARVLKRDEDGLRVTLNQNTPFASQFRSARVKMGRRVMFKATAIAQIINEA